MPRPAWRCPTDPSPTRNAMLKMTGLSKAYRTEVVETYALREFDLSVAQGEFVAVTGPSGLGQDDLPDDRRPAGAADRRALRARWRRRELARRRRALAHPQPEDRLHLP